MKMKVAATSAFLLNTVFFATYYSVAKEALGRIDPIVFSFFEMMSLVPAALCILALSWRQITRAVVKRGVILGSSLCLALFTISIALKYTSATSTAFFPSLNGFLAAFIAWIFLRQPVAKATWFAGLLSVVGAVLLITNAEMGGIRGSLIAFLGGLFFTCYVFLSDHEQKKETAHWPLFGIELLTMAVWANLVVLLFGDWQAVHPNLPKDIWVVIYVGGACTFLPTLITVLMQRYISPVTVSFIYILEPVLGAVMAAFYLHERLSLPAYIGGGLVVVGAFVQTWGSMARPTGERAQELARSGQRSGASLIGALAYPILLCGAGGFILYGLGGFPPSSWRVLYQLGPQLLTLVQQGQASFVLLLSAQALCWLVAWVALACMGLMTARHTLRKIAVHTEKAHAVALQAMPVGTYPMQAEREDGDWIDTMPTRQDWAYPVQAAQSVREGLLPVQMMPVVDTEPLAWEMRALRQMGISTYTAAKRKVDKPLVQRRRRERWQRLAGVDDADVGNAYTVQDLEAIPHSARPSESARPHWSAPEIIEVWQEG